MGGGLIERARVAEIAPRLRSGELDLEAYLDALCDRLDQVEPRLRTLAPEPGRRVRLSREARALKQQHPDPRTRPPLFGVPLGVKDIIAVDGLPTRAGSALPPELFAEPEASCVSRLRAAGALVLGKTVTTEFAFLDPGATANPHNPKHTPGGSSSGSAAAVAAGLAPLALGTQTVGSVNRPAAYCGIAGFKPSYGRIATDGVLPFSRSVDCVGSFAQDAAGIEAAASLLCEDWCSEPAARHEAHPALGVPLGPYLEKLQPDARDAFEAKLATLERAGFPIRRVPALEDIAAIAARHLALIAYEFAEVHAARFEAWGPVFRAHSASLFDRGRELGPDARERGRDSSRSLRAELALRMEEHAIAFWITPGATGPAPSGLASTGDASMSLPWTHAGLPMLTLPAGWSRGGLPLAVQLVGRPRDDELLVRHAPDLERAVLGKCPDGDA